MTLHRARVSPLPLSPFFVAGNPPLPRASFFDPDVSPPLLSSSPPESTSSLVPSRRVFHEPNLRFGSFGLPRVVLLCPSFLHCRAFVFPETDGSVNKLASPAATTRPSLFSPQDRRTGSPHCDLFMASDTSLRTMVDERDGGRVKLVRALPLIHPMVGPFF